MDYLVPESTPDHHKVAKCTKLTVARETLLPGARGGAVCQQGGGPPAIRRCVMVATSSLALGGVLVGSDPIVRRLVISTATRRTHCDETLARLGGRFEFGFMPSDPTTVL